MKKPADTKIMNGNERNISDLLRHRPTGEPDYQPKVAGFEGIGSLVTRTLLGYADNHPGRRHEAGQIG